MREKIDKMAMPQIKTFPVQISGGYLAQVRLHLPPGLREEEITRYPLVVQVYVCGVVEFDKFLTACILQLWRSRQPASD